MTMSHDHGLRAMTYKRRAMMPSINKAQKSEIMSSGTMRSSIMRSKSRITRSKTMKSETIMTTKQSIE